MVDVVQVGKRSVWCSRWLVAAHASAQDEGCSHLCEDCRLKSLATARRRVRMYNSVVQKHQRLLTCDSTSTSTSGQPCGGGKHQISRKRNKQVAALAALPCNDHSLDGDVCWQARFEDLLRETKEAFLQTGYTSTSSISRLKVRTKKQRRRKRRKAKKKGRK